VLRKKAGIGIPLDSPELPPQPPLLSEGEAADVELATLLTEFLLFGGISELINERYYYYGVFLEYSSSLKDEKKIPI
jgi:hypothetical protein